jgi:hypothetical protein
MVPAHVVSGWLKQTGYLGTLCSPTLGLMMNAETVTITGHGVPTPVPVKPGILLPNFVQYVPLSFADPKVPGASAVAEVPIPGCFTAVADLTAYVSGPPTAPAWTGGR